MMQLKIVGSDKGPVWLVERRYSVGKGDSCNVKLPDKALQDTHLYLEVDGDAITLVPEGQAPVKVNAEAVRKQCALKHGDSVKLGQSELQVVDPKVIAKETARVITQVSEGWVLQGLSTALSEKRYAVSQTQVVGRAMECDITLGVAHLSRQHARLTLGPSGLMVEDLGSVNGTYVNGKRVDKALLKNGDELRFDTLRFRVVGPKGSPDVDNDLDKTSLRPSPIKPVAPQQKPRAQGERPRTAARSQPRRPTGPATAAGGRNAQPAATQSTSRGGLWWLLGAVLVTILGALGWYFGGAGLL